MATARIPEAFRDLFRPARHKAFYGGRGSGKSHSFAAALALQAAKTPLRVLCAREIQKSVKESAKRLIEDKIAELGLSSVFKSTDAEIRGANGSRFFFAGLRSNPEAIKSMEGLDRVWVEEADRVSQRSVDLLVPTVRKPGSELWWAWNPQNEFDPVDLMFRGKHPPPDAVVRRVSWADNPWFPEVLRAEMAHDLATDPDKHAHVWLGEYRRVAEGAYYARLLSQALAQGRIGRVPVDPALEVWTAWDLGVGDATAIWLAQVVGREVRLVDYVENSGVGLEWYARALRERGHVYAPLVLPHDAMARELGTGKSRAEMLEALGFKVRIAPRLGVADGIEAVRRLLPRTWIDAGACGPGLKALGEYHERVDERRRVGLGPRHDWSSHAADALRYLAVAVEEPRVARAKREGERGLGGWMG